MPERRFGDDLLEERRACRNVSPFEFIHGDDETRAVMEDGGYWVERAYEFFCFSNFTNAENEASQTGLWRLA